MSLDHLLIELLKTNKNVIVPGLGSFIKSEGKSSFTILFNQFLKFNDRVLQKAVEADLNCSTDEAKQHIESYANQILASIESDGSYLIPGLGNLFIKGGKFTFQYLGSDNAPAKVEEKKAPATKPVAPIVDEIDPKEAEEAAKKQKDADAQKVAAEVKKKAEAEAKKKEAAELKQTEADNKKKIEADTKKAEAVKKQEEADLKKAAAESKKKTETDAKKAEASSKKVEEAKAKEKAAILKKEEAKSKKEDEAVQKKLEADAKKAEAVKKKEDAAKKKLEGETKKAEVAAKKQIDADAKLAKTDSTKIFPAIEQEEEEPTILNDIEEAKEQGVDPIVSEADVKTAGNIGIEQKAVEVDIEEAQSEKMESSESEIEQLAKLTTPIGVVSDKRKVEKILPEEVKEKPKRKKKGLLWIGSIFILSGLAVVAWVGKDQIREAVGWNSAEIADFTINEDVHHDKTLEKEIPKLQVNTPESSDTLIVDADTIIAADVEVPEPIIEKEEPIIEKEEPTPPSTTKLYHIIGGAFSIEDNASVFVADLKAKGYTKAVSLGKRNGLYTVSFGGFATKDGAKAELKAIKEKSDSDGGWILYY